MSPPSCLRVRASDSATSARLVRRTSDWSSGVTKAIFKPCAQPDLPWAGARPSGRRAELLASCPRGRGYLGSGTGRRQVASGDESDLARPCAGAKLEKSARVQEAEPVADAELLVDQALPNSDSDDFSPRAGASFRRPGVPEASGRSEEAGALRRSFDRAPTLLRRLFPARQCAARCRSRTTTPVRCRAREFER